MALLGAPQARAPRSARHPARQQAAPAARRAARLEQLARAHRAGALLVDAVPADGGRIVIDPRAVACAIVARLAR